MAIYYNSNCSTLSAGCYLYNGPGLTNPVSNGYYSDGTNCFTVTGGAGYVSSMDSCTITPTTVYISGDISPNYSSFGGTYYGALYPTTTGYPAGSINLDATIYVPIYAYDDLSNYNTTTITMYNGTNCTPFSISGFAWGAYLSDWGPYGSIYPSSSGTQDYYTFLFTIGEGVACL
jgi:hypothetical protein